MDKLAPSARGRAGPGMGSASARGASSRNPLP